MSEQAAARKRARWTGARHVVQVAVLALFMLPLLATGWGLFGGFSGGEEPAPTPAELPFFGTLSSSTVFGAETLDPFAALQAALASKTLPLAWLAAALPVLAVYGLVRGRAFCGWACPVNLMLELVDALRRKLGIAVREAPVPRRAKIGVAAAVLVLSAITSIPVFEAFSPISAVNKGILLGSAAGLWTLAAIVAAELFWGHRVWCRALCPLGGFYEALGRAGQVNVRIDHDACVKCGACKAACLCDPAILEPAIERCDDIVRAGDCMACGACVDACPAGALAFGLGRGPKPADAAADEPDAVIGREAETGRG